MMRLSQLTLVALLVVAGGGAAGCEGCRRPATKTPETSAPVVIEAEPFAPAAVEPLIEPGTTAPGAETSVTSGGDDAREIYLADGTIVEVDQKTSMTVDRIEETDAGWRINISLRAGAIRLEVPSATGKSVEIRTPVASAGVRGTEFAVSHNEEEGTEVSVFSGKVVAATDGQEAVVASNRAARITRQRELRAAAIRQEVHQRWRDARTRIADRLIERFEIDIEKEETPDLNEVIRRVPEAARQQARQRMEERIRTRREELRAALRTAADTIDRESLSAQERFEKARQNWIRQDGHRRAVFRERVEESGRRWQRGLENLADTFARLGAETAAARLRASARRTEEAVARLADSLAATAHVEPRFTVAVGPAEGQGTAGGSRRLLAHPFPSLPGNHPLIRERHVLRYRVQIGPVGVVRTARYVSGSLDRNEAARLERLLRTWRFDAVLERKPEWREITIHFVAQPHPAPVEQK